MLNKSPTFLNCFFAVTFSFFTALLAQAELLPFEPRLSNPIEDKWTWEELKIDHSSDLLSIYPHKDDSLWIGLRSGALLYENQRFTHYGSEKGLTDRWTTQILRIHDGQIAALSGFGLYLFSNDHWEKITDDEVEVGYNDRAHYDAHTQTLFLIHQEGLWVWKKDHDPQIIKFPQNIVAISDDGNGGLWIVYGNQGEIFQSSQNLDALKDPQRWRKIKPASQYTSNSAQLMRDSKGNMWYLNQNYNDDAWVFSPMQEPKQWDLKSLGGSNGNTSILETKDGRIWIASRGILHYYENGQWKIYTNPEYKIPASVPLLAQMENGDLILAETGQLIQRIDYSRRKWKTYLDLHFHDQDQSGRKWFITEDFQIACHDPQKDSWFRFADNSEIIDTPLALVALSNGDVVCAGSHERNAAISIFDGEKWTRRTFRAFGNGISHLSVWETQDGRLFLGNGQGASLRSLNSGGLIEIDVTNHQYQEIRHAPEKTPYRTVGISSAPNEKAIWLSGDGLRRFDGNTSTEYTNDIGIDGSWMDNIHHTKDGSLWVTKWGNGVFQFKNGKWTLHNRSNGLASDFVSQLLPLDGGELVAITDSGYSIFVKNQWTPFLTDQITMNRESGLLKKGSEGEIWTNFTPIKWYYQGIIYAEREDFADGEFKTICHVPDKSPPETIITTADQSVFHNDLTTLTWTGRDDWSREQPEGMTYSYKIDHGEWSAFSPSHSLKEVFKEGKHTLRVRARDTELNIDPTPASIAFEIIPPLYKQRWFQITILTVLIIIVLLVIFIIRLRVRHLIEIEEVKLRFFTNISHELRTPLTLVLGPIEKAIERSQNPENKKDLALAYKSARRLRDLVDQLLDFRKAETGKIVIEEKQTELPSFLLQILGTFESLIVDKHQRLTLHTNLKKSTTMLDQDKFQKIVFNLISNAIKYSPEKGEIHVYLEVDQANAKTGPMLVLAVENDGDKIEKQDLNKIFTPYYQVSNEKVEVQSSTGIGLAFTKQLVESFKGSIQVFSPIKQDRGCRFELSFPLSRVIELSYQDKEILHEVGSDFDASELSTQSAPIEHPSESKGESSEQPKPLLLLAEDNNEIRAFLKGELDSDFNVIEATSGTEGTKLAKKYIPDIIITDVMMSDGNGFQLCNNIKSDISTNHIPVIILTALRSDDYQITGLEAGADDYLTKPVSPTLLKLKVRNILDSRLRMAERLKQQYKPETKKLTSKNSASKQFIDQATKVVEEQLSDPNFGADQFAKAFGMSRSVFYRKFTAITEESPAVFIRTLRLAQAQKLLLETDSNITEIAFSTGFSDSSAFSKAFKDYFGASPRDFRKAALNE